MDIETTLLYIVKGNKVLLAKKKRGELQDFVSGIGGKIDAKESPDECLKREVKEEANIIPLGIEKKAIIMFDYYYKGQKKKNLMHVYLANDYDGEVKANEEVELFWSDLNSLPYNLMVKEDYLWLDYVLEGRYLVAEFEYDEKGKLLTKTLDFVTESAL